METVKVPFHADELWIEFGVASGSTINYISKFTPFTVYGFDTFTGLPEFWRPGFEAGTFNMQGHLPAVNSIVHLNAGLIQDTLPVFLQEHSQKRIRFMHIDVDLYSASKSILELTKFMLTPDCIVVFDELVNYAGFEGETGELRAWHEFVTENDVNYTFLGVKGGTTPSSLGQIITYECESVAVCIHSIGKISF